MCAMSEATIYNIYNYIYIYNLCVCMISFSVYQEMGLFHIDFS